MDAIMSGEATPSQISAVLVALRMKGETHLELAGFAEGMRAHVLPVRSRRPDLTDTAGTGGDGASTFNISTTAALVAAAAGAAVAKHGNRAVSSASGSADVLEALGFDVELPAERVAESIDKLGFGFMLAPRHHPAMKHAAPVRRELGIRTVFNLLGPLTNPAGARRQVIGVYSPELVPLMASVLAELGVERALVVHGAGGVDELTTLGPNRACLVEGSKARNYDIDPADLGFEPGDAKDLAGGSPVENADRTRAILAGETGPASDTVVLNAAAALLVAGSVRTLGDGCLAARAAIFGGAAAIRLDELVAFSRASDAEPTATGSSETRGVGLMGRFRAALASPGLSGVAEVKRRSPSMGELRADADPGAISKSYAEAGAAAVSILVDEERFGGSWDDLRAARALTDVPLLAKGFFASSNDVTTAHEAGAAAIILLLRDLDDDVVRRLMSEAAQRGARRIRGGS